ncbi:MAG: PstS family phosphate ABC transporter substrate-binding protein [Fimbriimonadaceae bacterium]
MKLAIAAASLSLIALAGCGDFGESDAAEADEIRIDGSSTVYPVMQQLAELYQEETGTRIQTAQAGTGSGFARLADGQIAVANASRPIKEEEIETLRENELQFVEVPIAFDGLTIVVHSDNDWLQEISIEELQAIWRDDPTITRWNQLDPSYPDDEIVIYGPTDAHGTYDYFNEAVVGEDIDHTQQYQANTDYATLVSGVAGETNALGYVGYAYYEENKDKIRAVPVSSEQTGGIAVMPSPQTIQSGEYAPLSRPLLVYVRADALDNPLIADFADFMIENAPAAVSEVGYIPLPENAYQTALSHVQDRVTGSRMVSAEPGMTLDEVLALEASE